MQVVINLLLLLSMITVFISAVFTSQKVFVTVSRRIDFLAAREIHSTAAYWGYLLISMHIGMHWGMIVRNIHKIRIY